MKYLVIAGNVNQARVWAIRGGVSDNEWTCIHDDGDLNKYDLSRYHCVLTGTYFDAQIWQHRDHPKMVEFIRLSEQQSAVA